MPTYQYRCLHCQNVQAVFQGIQEAYAPPCPECGGFTEKFIGQAPTVIGKASQSSEMEKPEPDSTHHCGSACVLHQHFEKALEAD